MYFVKLSLILEKILFININIVKIMNERGIAYGIKESTCSIIKMTYVYKSHRPIVYIHNCFHCIHVRVNKCV